MSAGFLTVAIVQALLGQSAPGDEIYSNQRTQHIPVNVEESRRSQVRELRLFASPDMGQNWNLVNSVPPTSSSFTFTAPADGSFWFRGAAVSPAPNGQFRQEPENLKQGPPDLKMVIDTLKPLVKFNAPQREGDDVIVSWELQEDHPDWASFRLEYQPRDNPGALATSVPATAGFTGQARFRPNVAGAITVRLTVKDLAGNLSVTTLDVQGTVTTASFSPGNVPQLSTPAINVNVPSTNVTPPPIAATPIAGGMAPVQVANPPLATPIPYNNASVAPVAFAPPPVAQTDMVASPRETKSNLPGFPTQEPASWSVAQANPIREEVTGKMVASSDTPLPTAPISVPMAPAARKLPPLQFVNLPKAMIEYELSKVGPSGVGSVELWWSQNDGQSWELYAIDNDPEVKGAVANGKHERTVDLPGEGVFGFILVVKSRAGLGKAPPRAGDVPEIRVEVDMTAPVAQLFAPTPDSQRPGSLILKWNAKDTNLTNAPITLEWAEQKEGPWNVIATGIGNTGHHAWQLPERLPVAVYLRLRVRDLAGNEGIAMTSEAQLVDLSEPEGRLTSITVVPRR